MFYLYQAYYAAGGYQTRFKHNALAFVAGREGYKPRAKSGARFPEVVRKAFKLAAAEKPGATHVELPEDIAKRDAGTRPIEPWKVRRAVPD